MIKKYSYCLAFLTVMVVGKINAQNPAKLVAKIPFEIHQGSIMLTVKLNSSSRPLKLLFDTGADGMALSQSLADSIGLKVTRKQQASVVGNTMEISISGGNVVHLDSFDFKDQNIAVFKEMRGYGDGIIGNNITKKYISKVDFDKRKLSLYTFGDYQYEPGGQAIPVILSTGIFMIPGAVNVNGEQTYQGTFVFDTGAAYSLICFRPFVKQNKLLVSGFKPLSHGSTVSMGISTPTFSGEAASFSFSKLPLIKDLPITLMAGGGENENWNPGCDGSIGAHLISRYNFTINAPKSEIYLVLNKSYNYSQQQ